jgi:hypothetical protein
VSRSRTCPQGHPAASGDAVCPTCGARLARNGSRAATIAAVLTLVVVGGLAAGGVAWAVNRNDASAASAAYCSDLAGMKSHLDAINGGDLSSLEQAATQLRTIADEAPSDVAPDWRTIADGFDQVLAAFDAAGLDASDLSGFESGQLPQDVDMQALQRAMNEIQDLGGDDFEAAGEAISQHARDACDVELVA